jgi:hypothetical protein
VKYKKYYKRSFLNPKKGVATVESSYTLHDGGYNAEGNLKITDCNHAVNLEFGWFDVESKKESQQKLETLISELTKTKKFLFPEVEKI